MAKHSKQDVWDSARFIWENTSDISDRELIKRLKDAFDDVAPKSTGTISKRRNKYGWQKNNILDSNQEAKVEVKAGKLSNQEAKQEADTQKRKQSGALAVLLPKNDNKVQKVEAVATLEAGRHAIAEISTSVVKTVEEKAILINSHRRSWQQIRELRDGVINLSIDVMDEVLAEDPQLLAGVSLCEEEAKRIAEIQEADADELKRKMAVINLMNGTLQALTMSSKVISEIELPLNGITPDDFSESDTAQRLKNAEKLDGINEEQNTKRDEMQRRMIERARQFEKEAEAFEEIDSACSSLGHEDTEDVDYTDISDIDI